MGNIAPMITQQQWKWNVYGGTKSRSIAFVTGNQAIVSSVTATAGSDSISAPVSELRAKVPMVPNRSLKGVSFDFGGRDYVQLTDDTLVREVNPTSGGGTPAGSVTPGAGVVSLTSWTPGASPNITNWRGLLVPPAVGVNSPFTAFHSVFRTVSSPLRPGSLSVQGTMQDGTTFNVQSDTSGKINGARVKGVVDFEYGLVKLFFVNPGATSGQTIDLTDLGISGVGVVYLDLALINTVRYNAVAYSYLPLDADILGIDPVRLPSDGRVPIFRPGGFAVVGHTGEITAAVSNGQTINCGRVRLSRVRVIGADGQVINTGYSANLEAGTVTFSDVTGYSQPVSIQHRIEDMAVVRQVQINGEVTFTRALTHAYPIGAFVSTALVAGDLFSRVNTVFDQETWTNVWSDTVTGNPATATFNNTANPIVVTNRGALTERWALRFTNSTEFQIIGENVGVIGVGNTGTDCSPNNPVTGAPYFTVPSAGWGGGWSAGNVLRFNTIGAEFPVWVVRTVQQGPETVSDDSFTLLIRGDVNA
jgi:hypothetical protein